MEKESHTLLMREFIASLSISFMDSDIVIGGCRGPVSVGVWLQGRGRVLPRVRASQMSLIIPKCL